MINEISMNNVASYKKMVRIVPKNKISLIYGLNGAGKSTISNFLYNINDINYANCSVDMNFDDEILVYNQKFVNDYFYEEDGLKGIFTLSKENKDVIQKIESKQSDRDKKNATYAAAKKAISKIDGDIAANKEKLLNALWEIKTTYSGGDRVLEYCFEGLKRKELIFNKMDGIVPLSEAPKYGIEDLKDELRMLASASEKPIDYIEKISSAMSEIEGNEIFRRIISGSSEGAVAEFISAIGNADWVKSGLVYVGNVDGLDNADCPFCQQSTITKTLLDSIRMIFDESYEEDVEVLGKLKDRYLEVTPDLSGGFFEQFPFACDDLMARWGVSANKYISLIGENVSLMEGKISRPSEVIILKASDAFVDSLNSIIDEINDRIKNYNDKIKTKDVNIARIGGKFWHLMRWNYNKVMIYAKKTDSDLNSERTIENGKMTKAENEIASIDNEISFLRKETVNIEDAVDNINNNLIEIGIDSFCIVKHADKLYRISRKGDSSNTFHSLSEGEKTVISFLYFVELCKGEKSATASAKNKIIVVDDPISSLSHIYVFNIGQMIKRVFFGDGVYSQIFVLTHSLYFFYELTFTNKDKRDQHQSLFRVFKNGEGSSVVPMRYEEIQNDYQAYWSIIKDENSPPAIIANCMRNIIEYFFNFVQKSDFNNVFQKPVMRSDKFQSFYRYMNRESHSIGQNIFDIKEFDYSIFKEGLELIFKECGYLDHFKAMMK